MQQILGQITSSTFQSQILKKMIFFYYLDNMSSKQYCIRFIGAKTQLIMFFYEQEAVYICGEKNFNEMNFFSIRMYFVQSHIRQVNVPLLH